ncbi:MAG: hypothetical protein V1848_04025 [Candidatus Magasanikbacteria bacterium]
MDRFEKPLPQGITLPPGDTRWEDVLRQVATAVAAELRDTNSLRGTPKGDSDA